jgi:hypothetical protein
MPKKPWVANNLHRFLLFFANSPLWSNKVYICICMRIPIANPINKYAYIYEQPIFTQTTISLAENPRITRLPRTTFSSLYKIVYSLSLFPTALCSQIKTKYVVKESAHHYQLLTHHPHEMLLPIFASGTLE